MNYVTKLEFEIKQLKQELAKLREKLRSGDYENMQLRAQVREQEVLIDKLQGERDFWLKNAELSRADNIELRDRLNNNPYPDEFYNEN